MNYDLQEMIFTFIGGLGIFLFGIKYMGDGLQKTAGDRLRYILDKYTSNPFLGILAGIVVTVLIQSSSGTTVIVVGLVSAGLMNLRQAIGVVMGAKSERRLQPSSSALTLRKLHFRRLRWERS